MDGAGAPRLHVADLLREVAAEGATGCLEIRSPDGATGQVWLRAGRVYSVRVPGFRPMIGVRLLSSGRIGPDQLAQALEVQRTELPSWRIGDILVHLGFVSREEVDAFVLEQLRDQTADLLGWEIAAHGMLGEATTRDDVTPPVNVEDLLAHARERLIRWAAVVEVIGGADAVPVLATRDVGTADVVLGPHDWALLCKVDGTRTLADLARECGFTVHEAGQFVQALVGAGLLEIEIPGAPATPRWFQGGTEWVGTDLPDMDDSMARVTAALAELLATHPSQPWDEGPLEPVVALVAAPAAAPVPVSVPAPAPVPVPAPDAESAAPAWAEQEDVQPLPPPEPPTPGFTADLDTPPVVPIATAAPAAAAPAPPVEAPAQLDVPAPQPADAAARLDVPAPQAADAAAQLDVPAPPPPAGDELPWGGTDTTGLTPREAAAALTEWVRESPAAATRPQPGAQPMTQPTAAEPVAAPMGAPVDVAAPAPAPLSAPPADGPAIPTPTRLDPVDAAALMRELSSLSGGGDDQGASMRGAAVPRPAATTPPVEHHKKKRHGLFGR